MAMAVFATARQYAIKLGQRVGYYKPTKAPVSKVFGKGPNQGAQTIGVTQNWFGYGRIVPGMVWDGQPAAAAPPPPSPIPWVEVDQDKITATRQTLTVFRNSRLSNWRKAALYGQKIVSFGGSAIAGGVLGYACAVPPGVPFHIAHEFGLYSLERTAAIALNVGAGSVLGLGAGFIVHFVIEVVKKLARRQTEPLGWKALWQTREGKLQKESWRKLSELYATDADFESLTAELQDMRDGSRDLRQDVELVLQTCSKADLAILETVMNAILFVNKFKTALKSGENIDSETYKDEAIEGMITRLDTILPNMAVTANLEKIKEIMGRTIMPAKTYIENYQQDRDNATLNPDDYTPPQVDRGLKVVRANIGTQIKVDGLDIVAKLLEMKAESAKVHLTTEEFAEANMLIAKRYQKSQEGLTEAKKDLASLQRISGKLGNILKSAEETGLASKVSERIQVLGKLIEESEKELQGQGPPPKDKSKEVRSLTAFMENKTPHAMDYFAAAKLIRGWENPTPDQKQLLEKARTKIESNDPQFLIGQSFESAGTTYEIVSKLGQGGMGLVYTIKDIKTDRTYVLKIPGIQYLQEMERVKKSLIKSPGDQGEIDLKNALQQLFDRFTAEAGELRKIAHKNVMQVVDSDKTRKLEINGLPRDVEIPYYIGEYIDGISLEDLIKEAKITDITTIVREIIIPLLGALEVINGKGIIHRDIKPANIMVKLKPDGKTIENIVIIDFGVIHIPGGMGTICPVGTPLYMDPDGKSDLFSLALTIYKTIARQLPFDNAAQKTMLKSLINAQGSKNIKSGILGILEGMFQKRLTSHREIIGKFQEWLDGTSGPAGGAGKLPAGLNPKLAPLFSSDETKIGKTLGLLTSDPDVIPETDQGITQLEARLNALIKIPALKRKALEAKRFLTTLMEQ